MQMQPLLSVIAGPEEYSTLATGERCIIRQYKDKYQRLTVGDLVLMSFTDNPQTHGPAIVAEFLKVSAMAIGSLDTILKAHWRRMNNFGMSFHKAKELVLSFYPLPELPEDVPPERNPDELYVALYF